MSGTSKLPGGICGVVGEKNQITIHMPGLSRSMTVSQPVGVAQSVADQKATQANTNTTTPTAGDPTNPPTMNQAVDETPEEKIRRLENELSAKKEELDEKSRRLQESQPRFEVPPGMTRDQCREVFKRVQHVQMKKSGTEIFLLKNILREWDREENGESRAKAPRLDKSDGTAVHRS